MALRREMSEADVDAEGFLPFGSATVAELATRFRASGAWLLGLDGFMGSGKTPLASMFEFTLQTASTRLDLLLESPLPDDRRTYIERLNAERLATLLTRPTAGEIKIVDGVMLQKILGDRIPRNEMFLVYVAAVWSPHAGEVVWPEGVRMETTDLSPIPLYAEIETYHRAYLPHETSDAIVLRDADRNQLKGMLTSPDGQEFSIPAAVITNAGVRNWRARTDAYAFGPGCGITVEALGVIRPPSLATMTPGLSSDRLTNVMIAMRNAAVLPPVEVTREPGARISTLVDGAHRYFASVALGFTHIPCHVVST